MKGIEFFKENKIGFPGIYLGVVEDDNDPNKAGRVRVRILGLHSEVKQKSNTQGIPSNELPWAIPALPVFEGATSGIGSFSVPVKGSWLAIFFIGEDHNYPVYFANIAATPKESADIAKGFNDPDGKYPTIIDEPDWNRNARNQGDLIKDIKDENRTEGIPQFRSDSWDEPESPYAAEYPNNTVIETRDGGIVIEYDSTPENERYHIYHKKTKNYFEISGDGQTVYKSYDNNFEINIKDKNIHITENLNESIGGNKDTLISGSKTMKVEADKETNVSGDENTTLDGNVTAIIGGNELRSVGGTLNISVDGNVTISSGGNVTISSGGTITLDCGGEIDGVITGKSMCHFTGTPHADKSTLVEATK